DLSQQPIPEVPATSSSAWNALLQSTMKETVDPRVERWRGGLDALLVFLGLFSAIVTTFLVNSLAGLTEDKTSRTNELLVNLTEIIISLSGTPASELNISYPVPFIPDSSDIRINAYWSLSLTFSLTIAALALGCRGFLNMVTWSRHTRASDRLADIWTRWTGMNRVFRPVIEALGQLLIFPVFLFVLGILDMLISAVNGLLHPPGFMIFAFSLSVICIIPLFHSHRRHSPPCELAFSIETRLRYSNYVHPLHTSISPRGLYCRKRIDSSSTFCRSSPTFSQHDQSLPQPSAADPRR
ncbi:hypothetical protein C8F04DRAFT_964583, partial [Mycena alexandri]